MNFICGMTSPKLRAYGLVWPILGRLGRLDPSSNLGTPTIISVHGESIDSMSNPPKERECYQCIWTLRQPKDTRIASEICCESKPHQGRLFQMAETTFVMFFRHHQSNIEEEMFRFYSRYFTSINCSNWHILNVPTCR